MTPTTLVAWAALVTGPSPPPVLTISVPATIEIRAGNKGEASIKLTVAEGYHVQANPASEPYLIPLLMEPPESASLRFGRPSYPDGRPYRLQGADRDLSTYEGTFAIRLPLEAPKETRPGEVAVEGRLRYQACDARVCLRPTSVPFALRVRVLPPR